MPACRAPAARLLRAWTGTAFAALLAAGCARERATPAPHAAFDTTTRAVLWERGVVRFDGGRGHWQPCDGGEGGLLWDPTGTLRLAVTQVSGPGGSAYAEIATIRGDAPAAARGPARQHAWMVTGINRLLPDAEGGCNRPAGSFLYRASGNEPFWAVEVRSDSLILLQPDAPSRIAWPAPAPIDREGGHAWDCPAGPAAPALRLEITTEPCADGMSGAWNSGTATATLGSRTLHGCAYQGTGAGAPTATTGGRSR